MKYAALVVAVKFISRFGGDLLSAERVMSQNTRIANAAEPLRQSHQDRIRLLSDGVLPQGIVRDEIDASWRRSVSYGVNCLDGERVELSQDLGLLLDRNRLLIDAATPELDYLISQQGGSGLIILGDAHANVLAIEGRTEFLRNAGLGDLRVGSCWSEAARGTNAIGTALIEGRPTLINCGEHYLNRLSPFSCASVPMRDPQGTVVGVIDLTREGVMAQPQDSLATLMLAVLNIESRMFNLSYPNDLVLAFDIRPQYLGSAWQGLLVLAQDGEILAANQRACELLRVCRDALVGRRGSEVISDRLLQFIAGVVQGDMQSVQSIHGEFFFRALQVPRNSCPRTTAQRSRAFSANRAHVLADVAGSDSRIARSLHIAHKGLANDMPVLILGETGTGKEVVARALYKASARAEKPFIVVNCAAIPEGLIESELFGYREGAFTGSRKGGVVGRIMQAHGGTLFLDEIGDMPLNMQARLLRVLQERKVTPLGAGEELDVDVALICATHCDLKSMVQGKTFREDLYYRINGISLRLPALRERDGFPEFVDGMLKRLGAGDVHLDRQFSELLCSYDWPGNIRQLEMVLRAALAMRENNESVLGLEHLSDSLLDELTPSARRRGSIREIELELVRGALGRHQGNVSAAAETLGISRATLYRKLKQLQD